MATSSMIPYSNPAGKNQTSPSVQGTAAQPTTLPGATPGASATATPTTATSNPLIPAVASGGAVPSVTSDSLGSELSDIFGSGVGGAASSFLGSISGTDSVILQEYVKSLGPQMATAQAQTNAALGAGGVSANSSVAAIADANLQAQEFSSIAQESAALTQIWYGHGRKHDSKYVWTGRKL